MNCATCHDPIEGKPIRAKLGPIELPLCAGCAKVAQIGVGLLHQILR